MALGKARRGSMSPGTCDRGATKPKAILAATLWAAVLLARRVVARTSQTHCGYARCSRLAADQNPRRQNTSHFGDTTLAMSHRAVHRQGSLLLQLPPDFLGVRFTVGTVTDPVRVWLP